MVRRENEGIWGALCLLIASNKRGEEPCKVCRYPATIRAAAEEKMNTTTHARLWQRNYKSQLYSPANLWFPGTYHRHLQFVLAGIWYILSRERYRNYKHGSYLSSVSLGWKFATHVHYGAQLKDPYLTGEDTEIYWCLKRAFLFWKAAKPYHLAQTVPYLYCICA